MAAAIVKPRIIPTSLLIGGMAPRRVMARFTQTAPRPINPATMPIFRTPMRPVSAGFGHIRVR